MESGGDAAEGRKRSRAASTSCRSWSKKSGRVIGELCGDAGIGPRSRGFGLAFGFEGLGGDSAVGFLEKNLDLAFGFFELLLALGGKGNAFFEEFHGVVERKLRTLEFADDLFKTREADLEVRLLGLVGFFLCRRVHVFFAANSLRQGKDEKQGESLEPARSAQL